MTTFFYVEPELVIALNRKVIFVNPHDLQIFKEIELPEDLLKCGLKSTQPTAVDNDESSTPAQKPKNEAAPTEPPTIQHVCLSPDRLLFAVTTAGSQKAVLLYQCRPEHAKLLSVRSLARASSTLTFSSDSKSLLVVDKTGDCYHYDCVDQQKEPRMLLGHLSIVYDVLWTADNKYIITCDRDDKIRVTNYPDTHDIHGYCLGHREFVSELALLTSEVLVSVSGDKTLRLWHFESGKELLQTNLPAPGIRLVLRAVDGHKYQAAVLLHQPEECVALYEISRQAESDDWQISEPQLLSFSDIIPVNLCFVGDRLYVAGSVDERLTVRSAALTAEARAVPENWLKMIEEQFKSDSWKPENVSDWFRKHYDNVSDYLERKKRRIEEKQK